MGPSRIPAQRWPRRSGLLSGQLSLHLLIADLAAEHASGDLGKRAARPPVLPHEVSLACDRTVVGELVGAVSGRQRVEAIEVEVDRQRGALMDGTSPALMDGVGVGMSGSDPFDGRSHVDQPSELSVVVRLVEKAKGPRRMVGPHKGVIGVAAFNGVGNPRDFRISEAAVGMGPVLAIHQRAVRAPIPPVGVGVGKQEQPAPNPQRAPVADPGPGQYGVEGHLPVVISGTHNGGNWEASKLLGDLLVLSLSAVVGNIAGYDYQVRTKLI